MRQSDEKAPGDEIMLTGPDGKMRILISARSGRPIIALYRDDGSAALELSLDSDGRPAVVLNGSGETQPTVKLELDDKGAHLLMTHPQGANGYLFLNNAQRSGLVMNVPADTRRVAITVAADGTVNTTGLKEGE